ncbi:prefoldin subunit [Candidatus Woesearchaeota archaeon]|nr:prefoldin subunit [Candidatus Woesearchaeota archaeon]
MTTEEKIQQLQTMEHNLQQLLMQKQAFQAQLLEVESAQEEIKKSETVYKVVGGIMLKSEKKDVESELKEKNETLLLRIKNTEKQEETVKEKLKSLRGEVLEEIKKKKDKK